VDFFDGYFSSMWAFLVIYKEFTLVILERDWCSNAKFVVIALEKQK